MKGHARSTRAACRVHADNGTVVKERIFLDATNLNRLHDQITTIDHAYSRPWTVTRDYNRLKNPSWVETNCAAENAYVMIQKQTYFISADGFLMPTKKDQAMPDMKNFAASGK